MTTTSTLTETEARARATEYREATRRVAAAVGRDSHDVVLDELSEIHHRVNALDSTLGTWLLCERCDYSELARQLRTSSGPNPDAVVALAETWRESYQRTEDHIRSLG
jgi:hypothetical protein